MRHGGTERLSSPVRFLFSSQRPNKHNEANKSDLLQAAAAAAADCVFISTVYVDLASEFGCEAHTLSLPVI